MSDRVLTSDPAHAAQRVREALTAAGFPAARTAHASDPAVRPLMIAGYTVDEGPDCVSTVAWQQRLSADEWDAKLVEIALALTAAGFHAEREIRDTKDGPVFGWTVLVSE